LPGFALPRAPSATTTLSSLFGRGFTVHPGRGGVIGSVLGIWRILRFGPFAFASATTTTARWVLVFSLGRFLVGVRSSGFVGIAAVFSFAFSFGSTSLFNRLNAITTDIAVIPTIVSVGFSAEKISINKSAATAIALHIPVHLEKGEKISFTFLLPFLRVDLSGFQTP
jgi:hypothetical protein